MIIFFCDCCFAKSHAKLRNFNQSAKLFYFIFLNDHKIVTNGIKMAVFLLSNHKKTGDNSKNTQYDGR